VLAVDVSGWLRPGAATSPGRLFCHVYGHGKGQAQMIPGWPYSVIAARPSPARPVHQNPASPAQGGPQDQRTATPHPATTWAKPPRIKRTLKACRERARSLVQPAGRQEPADVA
jgi:hypothetical protein